ncbi:MAG: hypothetical protein WCB31_09725, partial [Nitrososphaeraceae archaeon]
LGDEPACDPFAICPADTALAGVVVNDTDNNPMTTPPVCSLNGLEKCPVGTDKEGLFAMGDGDTATTAPADTILAANCDDSTEICPANTALAGVVVEDPVDDNPATIPAICSLNGLEKCPVGTDLEGVFAMGDGNLATTVPDPLTPTCSDCIENALTDAQEVTFANYLAGFGLTLDTYCALPSFQSATTVEQVKTLLAGDFNPGASGIVLSDTQLDELAQCIFNALNADTMLQENCDLPDSNVEACPEDSPLENVLVQDDGDPLTIPDICSLNGLEKCPVGTDLEGVFAMGDADTATTAPLDLTLAANCEKWDVCPAGTALAGVTIDPDSPDTLPGPGDDIPDICTVQGLEKCPDGTSQAGHFVMGDGNLTTNDVFDMDSDLFDLTLAQICFSTDQQVEVCDADTDLAGIVVNDTDGSTDGTLDEGACFFNACPAGTALEGVALTLEQNNTDNTGPMSVADGIPDICTLNGLEKCPEGTIHVGHFVMGDGNLTTTTELTESCNSGVGVESVASCFTFWIGGVSSSNSERTAAIDQLVDVMFDFLNSESIIISAVNTPEFFEVQDLANNADCNGSTISGCPSPTDLGEALVETAEKLVAADPTTYPNVQAAVTAMMANTAGPPQGLANRGTGGLATLLDGLAFCIDSSFLSEIPMSILTVFNVDNIQNYQPSFDFRTQDTPLSRQSTPNVENIQQEIAKTSSESKITSQHEFRLPNLPFSFNSLGTVNEDPR